MKKQYKATDLHMQCQDHKFEIGVTYEIPADTELRVCATGFHSCDTVYDCFQHYSPACSRVFEVEASCEYGHQGKRCSRKIKFIRELFFYEVMLLANRDENGALFSIDNCNTNVGFRNIGIGNKGNDNRGNDNIGNRNRGNYNIGDSNEGNNNKGNNNLGDNNIGDSNEGNGNIGNNNLGNYNLGNYNKGNYIQGDNKIGNEQQ